MELVNYLRIIRRRWRLVLVITVVGVLLGSGTSLLQRSGRSPTGVTWYLAKHTLVSSDNSANLQLAADLTVDGEVPKRAAAKLGVDQPAALVANVRVEPRPDVGLLYIAAVGTDPQRVTQVADTFAEQLVVYLRDFGDTQKKARVDAINSQIDDLQNEYLQLDGQINGTTDAGQKKLLTARQTDLAKKINDLKDQLNAAQSQTAKIQTLTTLSTAEAIPVSQAAVDKLLATDTRSGGKSGSGATSVQPSTIDAVVTNTGPNPLLRALLGGLAGLLVASALVIVLDRIDPRIRTKGEAEDAFGWPVIGEIPPLSRYERVNQVVLSAAEPRSRAAEAFRVVRSALLFVTAGEGGSAADDDEHPIFASVTPAGVKPPADTDGGGAPGPSAAATEGRTTRGQVIMVTSPGPSEGKTTTTANLAAILAETGRSVLVINCDFRRPRVHTFLGCEDVPRRVVDSDIEGVKLVSQVIENPDQANPADVVHIQRQVIRNGRQMFDIVLLDTAPLLTTNDATEVLSVTDQVVIVARTGKTHKEAADRAAELLERRNAPVVGVVLTGATDVPTARYYYYGDNPERDEPEPGHEAASPFEELLDGVDGDTVDGDALAGDGVAPDGATPADDLATVAAGAPGASSASAATSGTLTPPTPTVDAGAPEPAAGGDPSGPAVTTTSEAGTDGGTDAGGADGAEPGPAASPPGA